MSVLELLTKIIAEKKATLDSLNNDIDKYEEEWATVNSETAVIENML